MTRRGETAPRAAAEEFEGERVGRRDNPLEFVRGDMPWDDEDPILFHVLTTVGRGPAGADALGELMRSGTTLVPAHMRGGPGRVKPIDTRAGDDHYVFLSAGRMYRGDESHKPFPNAGEGHAEPALAFRWGDVAARGPIGWRPHDLLSVYEGLVRRARRSYAQPTDAHLRALAEAATIWDQEAVRRLARLWLAALRASGDEAAGRRVAAEAKKVWQPFAAEAEKKIAAVPFARAEDVRWNDPFRVTSVRAHLKAYGQPPMSWPDILVAMFGPEFLLRGTLPMASASWLLDARTHQWVAVRGTTSRTRRRGRTKASGT